MRGDEIAITRKVKRLISEFKIGQIWSDGSGSFEVLKAPDNAKGLAQILDGMRKDERKL